jgi:hypothetical protein
MADFWRLSLTISCAVVGRESRLNIFSRCDESLEGSTISISTFSLRKSSTTSSLPLEQFRKPAADHWKQFLSRENLRND